MKKWLSTSLIILFTAGVVGTAGHFIGVSVANNIKMGKVTEVFIDKIETVENYKIKHLNLNFFDKETSHNIEFEFDDFEIHFGKNDQYIFKGDVVAYYDYLKIYSGSAVFLDDLFYLETHESTIVKENISFNFDDIKTFKDTFNNTTIAESPSFNFTFDFDIFDELTSKIKHIKTDDTTSLLFEYPLLKYNSTLMFYTDTECNVRKMKTLTALEYGSTLLSIDASNIESISQISIEKPNLEYHSLQPLLIGMSDLLSNFDKENGKGISVTLGDEALNQPLSIYQDDELLATLLGQFTIYNKNEKDDFVINYKGMLEFFLSDLDLPDVEVDITVQDDTFYIIFANNLKGSLKLSTMEELFEVNEDDLVTEIKSLLFNMIDLVGINHSFNNDYYLVQDLDVNDTSIAASLSLPVQKENETNKTISVEIKHKDSKFNTISFSDFTYENYKFSNLKMVILDELPEKPVINAEDYRAYDEIIKNLIDFN